MGLFKKKEEKVDANLEAVERLKEREAMLTERLCRGGLTKEKFEKISDELKVIQEHLKNSVAVKDAEEKTKMIEKDLKKKYALGAKEIVPMLFQGSLTAFTIGLKDYDSNRAKTIEKIGDKLHRL